MYKYFIKRKKRTSTTIYYCQLDGWNYYASEFRGIGYGVKDWIGSFYDDIEFDWNNWIELGEMPVECNVFPPWVDQKMIKTIFGDIR